MAALLNQLGIDKLSVSDRLTLIDQIWESLDAEDGTFDVPDGHQQLVLERLADPEPSPEDCITTDDLRARLEAMS
jgi:putative addiction module component (TIGR02574 family)